jgi:uncharacterized protein
MSATLHLRVTPRGGRNGVTRFEDGVLHVRVAAAPAEGAANHAVVELVSDALSVARSRITIRSGATSRNKVIEIDGIDDDALAARLAGFADTESRP